MVYDLLLALASVAVLLSPCIREACLCFAFRRRRLAEQRLLEANWAENRAAHQAANRSWKDELNFGWLPKSEGARGPRCD